MKFKFSEELRKKHLIHKNGERVTLIVLRCKRCKTIHKDSPAALLFYKLKLEKQQLHCQRCNNKAFTRSCRHVGQDELYRVALMKTTHLRKHIEDEIESFSKRDMSKIINVTEHVPKNIKVEIERKKQIKEVEDAVNT